MFTFNFEVRKQGTAVCRQESKISFFFHDLVLVSLMYFVSEPLRISLLFQQIASGVPVLVPSGPARVWKGSDTEPFDLFHLQPLCCLVEGERQVSHSQNTGISSMEHVVAY